MCNLLQSTWHNSVRFTSSMFRAKNEWISWRPAILDWRMNECMIEFNSSTRVQMQEVVADDSFMTFLDYVICNINPLRGDVNQFHLNVSASHYDGLLGGSSNIAMKLCERKSKAICLQSTVFWRHLKIRNQFLKLRKWNAEIWGNLLKHDEVCSCKHQDFNAQHFHSWRVLSISPQQTFRHHFGQQLGEAGAFRDCAQHALSLAKAAEVAGSSRVQRVQRVQREFQGVKSPEDRILKNTAFHCHELFCTCEFPIFSIVLGMFFLASIITFRTCASCPKAFATAHLTMV